MEENKKPTWEELSSRDKKAITKRMNKWFDMSEQQIVDFYNDKVDNYYEEDEETTEVEPTESQEEEKTLTAKEDVVEQGVSNELEPKVDEQALALAKRIDELESLVKAQEEVIKTSQNKIDKAYEILEAQGKDTDSLGAKLFGGESKSVQEEESQGFGKSLFERK